MSTTTPVHGHNSPKTDAEQIRKILEADGRFKDFLPLVRQITLLFETVVRKIWDDISNLYRLFRESTPAVSGGGGGTATPPAPIIPRAIGSFIYGNSGYALGSIYDDQGNFIQWDPVTKVRWRLWDNSDQRFYIPIHDQVSLVSLRGDIWIQADDGVSQPEHHYIDLRLTQGDPKTHREVLLGFDIGFDRAMAGAHKGKFFVDVFEFPREASNTIPSLLTAEIPYASSKKFRTTDRILTDYLISQYDMETGPGMKFYCNLTLFAQ